NFIALRPSCFCASQALARSLKLHGLRWDLRVTCMGPGSADCWLCGNASVLGPPRRTEAPQPHTRKLFCRSAAVLGRPRPAEPPLIVKVELVNSKRWLKTGGYAC